MVLGHLRHRFTSVSSLAPLNFDLGNHSHSAFHLVCAKSALEIPRVKLVADRLADEIARATV